MNLICYPAIAKTEPTINYRFPDFQCKPLESDISNLYHNAQIRLCVAYIAAKEKPTPTPLADVEVSENEYATNILCDLDDFAQHAYPRLRVPKEIPEKLQSYFNKNAVDLFLEFVPFIDEQLNDDPEMFAKYGQEFWNAYLEGHFEAMAKLLPEEYGGG